MRVLGFRLGFLGCRGLGFRGSEFQVEGDCRVKPCDPTIRNLPSLGLRALTRNAALNVSSQEARTCGTKLDHGVLVVGYGTEDAFPLRFRA